MTMSPSPGAAIYGSSCAAILEILIFHPFDTIAKRLMANTHHLKTFTGQDVYRVIFSGERPTKFMKLKSLYPGFWYASAYKLSQRIFKFAGQPIISDLLTKHAEHFFQRISGRNSKSLINATAGSIVGISEVILLPLDMLKVRQQTNPSAVKGKKLTTIFAKEGFSLYRGITWTLARNILGTFMLFGVSTFVKENVFNLENHAQASLFQLVVASTAGAVVSIIASSPMDVIKTRIQSRPYEEPITGKKVITELIKKEGISAFWKGVIPKVVVAGPKLIFAMTMSQILINHFHLKSVVKL